MKKAYVQFSKRVVTIVTIAVTAICVTGMILCIHGNDTSEIPTIIKAYIEYAMVVFVAYSGNSVAEKYLIKKYGTETDSTEG